jgi:hypothetical protein
VGRGGQTGEKLHREHAEAARRPPSGQGRRHAPRKGGIADGAQGNAGSARSKKPSLPVGEKRRLNFPEIGAPNGSDEQLFVAKQQVRREEKATKKQNHQ